jgi:hypothetical protein
MQVHGQALVLPSYRTKSTIKLAEYRWRPQERRQSWMLPLRRANAIPLLTPPAGVAGERRGRQEPRFVIACLYKTVVEMTESLFEDDMLARRCSRRNECRAQHSIAESS